jgi:hypothetical protein
MENSPPVHWRDDSQNTNRVPEARLNLTADRRKRDHFG